MFGQLIRVALCCACFGLIHAQCNTIQTGISTEKTKTDGTYMTYVGDTNATFIQCNKTCGNCSPENLYWRKDSQTVYTKSWIGGPTGPASAFEGRVEPVLIENNNDSYVLEWNQTLWSDLPLSSNSTNWECYWEFNACGVRTIDENIEYFMQPLHEYYVNDEREENCSTKLVNEFGAVNCTVLSRPKSRVSLWQGDGKMIADNSSCSPYYVHESVCSVYVPSVTFSLGFYCVAEYVSPESGANETIAFDGCGPGAPPEINSGGLEPWEIALISVSVAIVVGTIIGVALQLTGVVNITGRCKSSENVSY